jgi:hypothetical protein
MSTIKKGEKATPLYHSHGVLENKIKTFMARVGIIILKQILRNEENEPYQTGKLHTVQPNSCYRDHRGLYMPHNGINVNFVLPLTLAGARRAQSV